MNAHMKIGIKVIVFLRNVIRETTSRSCETKHFLAFSPMGISQGIASERGEKLVKNISIFQIESFLYFSREQRHPKKGNEIASSRF